MNSSKKSMRLAKIFAFALSFLMFCFSTAAMAATDAFIEIVEGPIKITNGGFDVDKTAYVASQTITSATVSLSPGNESGTIDQIEINGPDGTEFECENVSVKNGTNLIEACGSKQVNLKGGETTYKANGSNFVPPNGTLKVDLEP